MSLNECIRNSQPSVDSDLFCADCAAPNPSWFSLNFGILICFECAVCHRNLDIEDISIKSVNYGYWSYEELEVLTNRQSNAIVNEKLEKYLPKYFPKSAKLTPIVIRQEFIIHKYLRKTFESQQNFEAYSPSEGKLSAFLRKKSKNSENCKIVFVILRNNSLKIFTDIEENIPKIDLISTQFEFHIEQLITGQAYLAITDLSQVANKKFRRYYLNCYTPHDLFDWYFALQIMKLTAIEKNYGLDDTESINFTCGWVYKAGAHSIDRWRKRWFVIDKNRITYYKDRLSSYPQGYFMLGSAVNGYQVDTSPIQYLINPPFNKYTLQVKTPNRIYKLCVETELEKKQWVNAFNFIIENQTKLE